MPCNCKCHVKNPNNQNNPCGNCKVLHDQKKTFDYQTSVHQRMMEILSETYGHFKRDSEKYKTERDCQRQVTLIAITRLQAVIQEMAQHNIRYDFLVDQTGSCNPEPLKHAQPALHIHQKVDKVLSEVIKLAVRLPGLEIALMQFYQNATDVTETMVKTGAMAQASKIDQSVLTGFFKSLEPHKPFNQAYPKLRDKIKPLLATHLKPGKTVNGQKLVNVQKSVAGLKTVNSQKSVNGQKHRETPHGEKVNGFNSLVSTLTDKRIVANNKTRHPMVDGQAAYDKQRGIHNGTGNKNTLANRSSVGKRSPHKIINRTQMKGGRGIITTQNASRQRNLTPASITTLPENINNIANRDQILKLQAQIQARDRQTQLRKQQEFNKKYQQLTETQKNQLQELQLQRNIKNTYQKTKNAEAKENAAVLMNTLNSVSLGMTQMNQKAQAESRYERSQVESAIRKNAQTASQTVTPAPSLNVPLTVPKITPVTAVKVSAPKNNTNITLQNTLPQNNLPQNTLPKFSSSQNTVSTIYLNATENQTLHQTLHQTHHFHNLSQNLPTSSQISTFNQNHQIYPLNSVTINPVNAVSLDHFTEQNQHMGIPMHQHITLTSTQSPDVQTPQINGVMNPPRQPSTESNFQNSSNPNSPHQNSQYPNSPHQNLQHPHSPHPNSSHPNSPHPNSPHPNSPHPISSQLCSSNPNSPQIHPIANSPIQSSFQNLSNPNSPVPNSPGATLNQHMPEPNQTPTPPSSNANVISPTPKNVFSPEIAKHVNSSKTTVLASPVLAPPVLAPPTVILSPAEKRQHVLDKLLAEKKLKIENSMKKVQTYSKAFQNFATWHQKDRATLDKRSPREFKMMSLHYAHYDSILFTYPTLFHYLVLSDVKLGYHHDAICKMLRWNNWKGVYKTNRKFNLAIFSISILRGLLGEAKFYGHELPTQRQLFLLENTQTRLIKNKFSNGIVWMKVDASRNDLNSQENSESEKSKYPLVKYSWTTSDHHRIPIFRLLAKMHSIVHKMDSFGSLCIAMFGLKTIERQETDIFYRQWNIPDLGYILQMGEIYANWIKEVDQNSPNDYQRLVHPRIPTCIKEFKNECFLSFESDHIFLKLLDFGLVLYLLQQSLILATKIAPQTTVLTKPQISTLAEYANSVNSINGLELPTKPSKKKTKELGDLIPANIQMLYQSLLDNFTDIVFNPIFIQFMGVYVKKPVNGCCEQEERMVLNFLLRCDLMMIGKLRLREKNESDKTFDKKNLLKEYIRTLCDPIMYEIEKHTCLKLDIFIRFINVLKKHSIVELMEWVMIDFFELVGKQFNFIYSQVS